MGEEKREYRRWPATLVVVYGFAGQESSLPPIHVRSFDFGEGGMRLILPEKPKEKDIELRIYLPYARRPLFACGEIVWMQEIETEEGTYFQTGIHFTQIQPADKQKLLSFVYSISEFETTD